MPAHGYTPIEHDPEDCPLCEVYPRGGYMRGEYWRELGADALRAENERLWDIEGKYNAVMAENERLKANTIALHKLLDKWSSENERLRAALELVEANWHRLTPTALKAVRDALGEQAKD